MINAMAIGIAIAFSAAARPVIAELPPRDATIIAEAHYLRQALGEQVWPGWAKAAMPLVYIRGEHEFAIGFDRPLEGFEPSEQRVADRPVQVRARQLETTLAAAYDFQGIPAVVIGTPEALQWSPTEWALKAGHEMFHVLSMQRGGTEKVGALGIGSADDASWQLDYPFPYDDPEVMRLMHLQAYAVYLAISAAPPDGPDVKYNAGTALEALAVIRAWLLKTTGDERAAKYAMFQEGEEGAGRYTEYRLAQLASGHEYVPSEAFRGLEDFVPYPEVWESAYLNAPFVIKHAGRAVKTRTIFYYTGMGKCLLLDRLDPAWKRAFLQEGAWLDELLVKAAGG